MDEDSGDKGDSDSDELDHRYYLWSDYDSYFISNHTFFRSGVRIYILGNIPRSTGFTSLHYNLLFHVL